MIRSDSAIAYGLASTIVLLVVGACLYVMFIPWINGLGTELNERAANKEATWETMASFSLVQTMYQYGVPIFLLLIALYYAINRALLKKREEGYG